MTLGCYARRAGEPMREAPLTSPRRFPPPWQVEQTPGGFKVLDANGQALAYIVVYVAKLGRRIRGICP
jgi:hypothetical protein